MRRSTPLTWEQVRTGVLILVSLGLLATGVFYVGEIGNVFGERYNLVTLVRSGAGLAPGAAVQLAGQNVGQVRRVDWLDPRSRPESGEAVAISLAIDREVQNQIRADSRAHIRTQGLLGDRVVDIDPGTAEASVLEPGDTVRSVEPFDYQVILEQASGAVTDLSELAERLTELTSRMLAGEGSLGQLVVNDSLYDQLTRLGDELARFVATANAGEGTLGSLLHESELYDRLVTVTANLDTLTTRVAAGEGSLGMLVTSDSLYRELVTVAERGDALLRRLEEGEGTAGKLVTDDRLYEELLKTLTDMNTILQDLREQPRKYIPPITVF